jgi:hypothetical protein
MKFKDGERVKWIQRMTPVPHPEGKTDREGNVLPVLRDKEMTGRIRMVASKDSYFVWVDGTTNFFQVKAEDIQSLDG